MRRGGRQRLRAALQGLGFEVNEAALGIERHANVAGADWRGIVFLDVDSGLQRHEQVGGFAVPELDHARVRAKQRLPAIRRVLGLLDLAVVGHVE